MLAGLLDQGRRLSAVELAKMQLRRAALTGELNRLLASVDLLLMPVMARKPFGRPRRWQAAGRDPETVAARLRYTAPFDLSGHPTLTLPGGITTDGRAASASRSSEKPSRKRLILAAGHAYQRETGWHMRRPPL